MAETIKLTIKLMLEGKEQLAVAEVDAKQFGDALKKAQGSVGELNSKLINLGAALSVFSVAKDLASQAWAVISKPIDLNAQMEQYRMSFKVFLKSADAAKERMDYLAEYAAKTPFELPEVVQASRMLQVMGGTAIATGETLTMVGDMAAASGAQFGEIAMWVGRAYSAIQSGRPFGEAGMRLQELGLMSGEVRNKLEALQARGASSTEMWKAFTESMKPFGGMMAELSVGFKGLLSTLIDNINAFMRIAGEDIFEQLKESLKDLMARMEAFAKSPAADEIKKAIKSIGSVLGDVIKAGFDFLEWASKNIGLLKGFAVGVGAAVIALKAMQIATGLAALQVKVLGAAIMANPVGLIVTAVGALTAGLFYLDEQIKRSEEQARKDAIARDHETKAYEDFATAVNKATEAELANLKAKAEIEVISKIREATDATVDSAMQVEAYGSVWGGVGVALGNVFVGIQNSITGQDKIIAGAKNELTIAQDHLNLISERILERKKETEAAALAASTAAKIATAEKLDKRTAFQIAKELWEEEGKAKQLAVDSYELDLKATALRWKRKLTGTEELGILQLQREELQKQLTAAVAVAEKANLKEQHTAAVLVLGARQALGQVEEKILDTQIKISEVSGPKRVGLHAEQAADALKELQDVGIESGFSVFAVVEKTQEKYAAALERARQAGPEALEKLKEQTQEKMTAILGAVQAISQEISQSLIQGFTAGGILEGLKAMLKSILNMVMDYLEKKLIATIAGVTLEEVLTKGIFGLGTALPAIVAVTAAVEAAKAAIASFAAGGVVTRPTLAVIGDAARYAGDNTEYVFNTPQVRRLLLEARGGGASESLLRKIVDRLDRLEPSVAVYSGVDGEKFMVKNMSEYEQAKNRTRM